MKTFFYNYRVEPRTTHPQYYEIGGAFAHAWVLADSQEEGEARARSEIEKYHWDILEYVVKESGETWPEQYLTQDLGLANYYKAQRFGIALAFSAYETGGDSKLDDLLK